MSIWNSIKEIKSKDCNVSKFVFEQENCIVESVLYKYPTFEERTVICCSTQSGCPVGCRFCGTGDYFVRSLTAEEIVSQPVHLLESTGVDVASIKKLQIMFMSMGEPMYNYEALKKACIILYAKYPNARLLISTSAPRNFKAFEDLRILSSQIPTIGLQFSVHESTDEDRAKLIPSATMLLSEIAEQGKEWSLATGRRPFFNYCVHPNNNSDIHVSNLLSHFDPSIWEATISVICERDESVAAANQRQRQLAADFMDKMVAAGYSVRMFDPAGQDDIGGGCGQLWFVQSWMANNKDKIVKTKGFGLPKVHTPKSE